jgi:excisionase family DNA binding protein
MQVIATWSGGRADLLRQAFRMTNESYAEYLTVSVRTVANWRGNPDVIPRPAIQDILDAALEHAPDRVKAQFALLIGEAETGNQRAGHVESFEASLNAASNVDVEGFELLESIISHKPDTRRTARSAAKGTLGGSNRLLSSRDVAAILAIPERSVRDKWKEWGLPAYRIGKHLRWKERDVYAWIERQSV